MRPEYILSIVLGALLILSEARFYFAERRWCRERDRLCNRLQAGTLPQYAAYRGVVETEGRTMVPVVAESLEQMTALVGPQVSEDALASARSSFQNQMG